MIEYNTVAIKRIDITSDFTLSNYDANIISSSELVFVNNPFSKYLKKVIIPIKKSLKMTLPEGYTPEVFDDIRKRLFFCIQSIKIFKFSRKLYCSGMILKNTSK